MKLNNSSLSPPRIEMLPLIDIVFLLLVFFIYAMLSMAVHHGQSVDLPQSSSAVLEMQDAISITIQAADQGMILFVDEEPVNLEILREILMKKKEEKQDWEVQIFADKSVSYQELFQVLDRVRLAGLTRISLQAEPQQTSP
ncbi:MAG: biopolymer transporter ExbD [Desulfobulbaceae bacterium]|nr:biopolymer transporter ExbD [Desulfobulbaceae bacterium]